MRPKRSPKGSQKGPRGVPGYHFSLIFDGFGRSLGRYFGGILIDVEGVFASQWEVFSHCIKGLSDVCLDVFLLYLGSYSGYRVPGIPI